MQNPYYKESRRRPELKPIILDSSAWSYISKKGECFTAELFRVTVLTMLAASFFFFMLTAVYPF
jgi:hypothetical protein